MLKVLLVCAGLYSYGGLWFCYLAGALFPSIETTDKQQHKKLNFTFLRELAPVIWKH